MGGGHRTRATPVCEYVSVRLLVPLREPPLLLRPLVWIAERKMGRRMISARVLSWSWRVALVCARLELGVEAAARGLPRRIAGLVRIKISLRVECPYCIDLNTAEHEGGGITVEEVLALRDEREETCTSFTERERALLAWIGALVATPVRLNEEVADSVVSYFSPSELVRLCALAAKVDFFARFMAGLGVPPEGASPSCPYLPRAS